MHPVNFFKKKNDFSICKIAKPGGINIYCVSIKLLSTAVMLRPVAVIHSIEINVH